MNPLNKFAFAAAIVMVASVAAQAQCPNCPKACAKCYGTWFASQGISYLEFHARGGKNYLVWRPGDPKNCYCYDAAARVYWGKWTYTQWNDPKSWEFRPANPPAPLIAETQFTAPAPPPRIAANEPLPPPSDLPPVEGIQ